MAWLVCSSVSVRMEASQEVVPFFAKNLPIFSRSADRCAVDIHAHCAVGVNIDKAGNNFAAGGVEHRPAGLCSPGSSSLIFPPWIQMVFSLETCDRYILARLRCKSRPLVPPISVKSARQIGHKVRKAEQRIRVLLEDASPGSARRPRRRPRGAQRCGASPGSSRAESCGR